MTGAKGSRVPPPPNLNRIGGTFDHTKWKGRNGEDEWRSWVGLSFISISIRFLYWGFYIVSVAKSCALSL